MPQFFITNKRHQSYAHSVVYEYVVKDVETFADALALIGVDLGSLERISNSKAPVQIFAQRGEGGANVGYWHATEVAFPPQSKVALVSVHTESR